ncbi:MAG TPA: hypothetical protein VNZ45_10890 [Bacteroidia bacterium]|jgi:hypothetical protein|nr:hypothetical protein [Bacteroidia bacterium]
MRNLISIGTILVFLCMYSCDKITNPIINKGAVVSVPLVAPTHVDSTTKASDTTLNILVEDYTAHNCTNCPIAGAQCEALVKGIHSNQVVLLQDNVGKLGSGYKNGSFAGLPNNAFGIDYVCIADSNWNNIFIKGDLNGLPGTMVNRLYYAGVAGSPDLFLNGIDVSVPFDSLVTANNKTASIHIVDSMYTPPTSTLSMTITTKLLSPNPSNKYYLVVALAEDSVFDWQDSVGVDVQYYLKRMTTRVAINANGSGWGDTLSAFTTAPQSIHYAYSNVAKFAYASHITVPPPVSPYLWNMAHMYLVAFVYQKKSGSQDYMVLQAQKLHI